MKTIRSRFLMGMGIFIFIFFTTGEFIFWSSLTFLQKLNLIIIGFVAPYATFTTKIKYCEDYLYFCSGWRRGKIEYLDVVEICNSSNPFGYTLKTFDGVERKFLLMFPFEHKKMGELFEAIERINPNVQIAVWWYKKSSTGLLKTGLKWAAFIAVVFAADFFYNKFVKH